MRDFMNIVDEQAIARVGNWAAGSEMVASLSKFIYGLSYEHVQDVAFDGRIYSLSKHKEHPIYIIGKMQPVADASTNPRNAGKEEFGVACKLRMAKIPDVAGFTSVMHVEAVSVESDSRGYGIAKWMYKWLVAHGTVILGDLEQYFGARKLWVSLSRDSEVVVDIIDIDKNQVIERDAALHHGDLDVDFDKRVWDYGGDMAHIRLILRDII